MPKYDGFLRRDLPHALTRNMGAGDALRAFSPDERAAFADICASAASGSRCPAEYRCRDGIFMQTSQKDRGFY